MAVFKKRKFPFKVDWEKVATFIEKYRPGVEMAADQWKKDHPEWLVAISGYSSTFPILMTKANIEINFALKSNARPNRLMEALACGALTWSTDDEKAVVANFVSELIKEKPLRATLTPPGDTSHCSQEGRRIILTYKIQPIDYTPFKI